MDLILWCHAEAEVSTDDMARALTRNGQQQAARMARWLRERLPDSTRVLCSEPEILRLVNRMEDDDVVVLVGHQPWIGALASTMMTGEARCGGCSVVSGAG